MMFSADVVLPLLRIGSTGASVMNLQASLNQQGYGPIAQDGNYGTATRDAVIALQNDSGIAADGICGAATWNAIMGTPTQVGPVDPAPAPAPSDTPPATGLTTAIKIMIGVAAGLGIAYALV